MKRITIGLLLASAVVGVTSATTQATGGLFSWKERPDTFSLLFTATIASSGSPTLGNYLNNGEDGDEETVSEIVAATADGMTLVYTDAVRGTIGFIDITNPSNRQPLGTFPVGPDASPTAVAVLGNRYALVAVTPRAGLRQPVRRPARRGHH